MSGNSISMMEYAGSDLDAILGAVTAMSAFGTMLAAWIALSGWRAQAQHSLRSKAAVELYSAFRTLCVEISAIRYGIRNDSAKTYSDKAQELRDLDFGVLFEKQAILAAVDEVGGVSDTINSLQTFRFNLIMSFERCILLIEDGDTVGLSKEHAKVFDVMNFSEPMGHDTDFLSGQMFDLLKPVISAGA